MSREETIEEKLERFQRECAESHDYIEKLLAGADPFRGVKFRNKRGELNAQIIGCKGDVAFWESRKQVYLKRLAELEAQLKKLEDDFARGYPIV